MTRIRRFLDIDVLTAAKDRIRHAYEIFDSVAVAFSGGKDSLTVLHLAWEIAQELGKDHVDAIFRDEELIPDQVVDFVNEYRQKPWVRLRYFAVPLRSTKYILGESKTYVQWDPGRAHIRPVPAHAIVLESGDTWVFDEFSMDAYTANFFRGKVAILTGIRASESIMRYRASVNKLHENWINEVHGAPNVRLCKPIYDWEEADVLRFFYDRQIRYCPIYDQQDLAGVPLRVATPLHAEAAKRIGDLRRYAPTFYQQVMDLFPEMLVQERYYRDMDTTMLKEKYGDSWEGIRQYIDEHVTEPAKRDQALRRLRSIMSRERIQPGAYPTRHVFNYFKGGAFHRECLPAGRTQARKRAAGVA